MADEKRPQDLGSITQRADDSDERISEISNVSRTINQMQRKVNQELADTEMNIGDYEHIEEVQNSMIKVLSSLSATVGSIGQGFARVASDTANASKDAVKQYGKAISQDISFNKQNIVAMALARSSPIFGYFAAKFVETDVFQSAKEKMKANIAEALSGVTSKFRQGFKSIFGGGKGVGKEDKAIRTIKTAGENAVPKMQSGGYIEKAGLAYVHPAEVVMPIEKVLEKIDASIDTTKELASISKQAQLKTMARMHTYVEGVQHLEKVGIFKGFIRALNDVQTRHTQPAEKRMLRAVLSIQESMGATVGTWPQVWQKMLVEHPTFRNIMFSLRSIGKFIGTPINLVYQLTKSRGGYAAQLSRSKNPMEAAAENIGLVYAEGMWRLDSIALYTRATAQATQDLSRAFTGANYPKLEGAPTGTWSIFSFARKFTNLITKWSLPIIGGALFGKKGWEGGKAKGEWLTEEKEFFLDKYLDKLQTRKFRKAAYGLEEDREITPLSRFSDIFISIVKDKDAMPIIDITPVDTEKIKMERKQLTYQKETMAASEKIMDLTAEMNDREERRSFFSFLSGGGGIFGGLMSAFSSGGIMGILGSIFSSTVFVQGLATVIAGGVGMVIGHKLDEMLGITKAIQGSFDESLRLERERAQKTTTAMFEDAKTAREEGGTAGYLSQRKVKEMAGVTKVGKLTEKRYEDMGWLAQNHLVAIDNAQREYIAEHIEDYSKYDPNEIASLRRKWIREGSMRGRGFMEDPHQYGLEREKAFHTYLYRNATEMDTWRRRDMQAKYQQEFDKANRFKNAKEYILNKYQQGKTYLIDKATGVYKDVSQLAANEVDDLLAQGAIIVNELEHQGEKALAHGKEQWKDMKAAAAQSTAIISTNITNSAKTISTTASRAYNDISDYAKEVSKGRIFED